MPKLCRTPPHSSAVWPRSSGVAEAREVVVDEAELAREPGLGRDLADERETDARRGRLAARRGERGELQAAPHALHAVVGDRELPVRRRDALLRTGVLAERAERDAEVEECGGVHLHVARHARL